MYPLAAAVKVLTDRNIPVQIVETRPCSNKFILKDDCQYILRQNFRDGICHVVVAAKMGKEVQ
jgi:hypothetical protein